MGRVYRHEGRSGDGRGIRWSDASDSRKRNATFSDTVRPSGKPDRRRAERIQEAAAAIIDRNYARGKRPGTVAMGLTPPTPPDLRAADAKRQRDVLRAIHEQAHPNDVARFRTAFLTPGDSNAKDRSNLWRFMRRNGLAPK